MKTALITGGSAGLGKITSETLAGLGYRVVIAARDEVKGQRVVREILEKHPSAEVEFAQVDMADYTTNCINVSTPSCFVKDKPQNYKY